MKIYTKTGDNGTSSLYNGKRRNKNDAVFEALGTTDELSSHIGLALAYLDEANNEKLSPLMERLERIQCLLQDVGSNLATPRDGSNETQLARTKFDACHTEQLEAWIDEMDGDLPPLTAFILPSGGKASASLHVSRSVCRRAERCVQPLAGECDESVFIFLNRLSDFLFNAARWTAKKLDKAEKVYKKP